MMFGALAMYLNFVAVYDKLFLSFSMRVLVFTKEKIYIYIWNISAGYLTFFLPPPITVANNS